MTPSFEPLKAYEPERAVRFGVGAAALPIWGAFIAAAGAGAAFWWATRGLRAAQVAQTPTALLDEPRSFAPEEVPTAAPEAVMAHQDAAPETAPDPLTHAPLGAAPEEVMEHSLPKETASVETAPAVEPAADLAPLSFIPTTEASDPQAIALAETSPVPTAEAALDAVVEAIAPAPTTGPAVSPRSKKRRR